MNEFNEKMIAASHISYGVFFLGQKALEFHCMGLSIKVAKIIASISLSNYREFYASTIMCCIGHLPLIFSI